MIDKINEFLSNQNLWWIILIIVLLTVTKCSSAQQADTIRIQERSQSTIEQLDKAANSCNTQECKDSMKQAKELIKDSLDVIINKDSEIKSKEKEIQNSSIYTSTGKFVIWGAIIFLIFGLIYIFRDTIFNIIKVVKPF